MLARSGLGLLAEEGREGLCLEVRRWTVTRLRYWCPDPGVASTWWRVVESPRFREAQDAVWNVKRKRWNLLQSWFRIPQSWSTHSQQTFVPVERPRWVLFLELPTAFLVSCCPRFQQQLAEGTRHYFTRFSMCAVYSWTSMEKDRSQSVLVMFYTVSTLLLESVSS